MTSPNRGILASGLAYLAKAYQFVFSAGYSLRAREYAECLHRVQAMNRATRDASDISPSQRQELQIMSGADFESRSATAVIK